jgi:predicted PurR-regulated permease PerM
LGDETVSLTLNLTLNTVGALSAIFLTIVLTVYLLLDGQRVWQALFQSVFLKKRLNQGQDHDRWIKIDQVMFMR